MSILKALLLSLFLIGPVSADETGVIYSPCWGGINDYLDSSKIDPCDAQQAQNVLTDRSFLEKRPGNTRLATVLTGNSVKYLSEFIANDAVRYLIAHASSTVYFNTPSSSTIAIATMSLAANIDTANGFSRVMVVNGLEAPFTWTGSVVSYVAGMPRCSLIEFKDDRWWCAAPISNTSQVIVSSFGGTQNSWDLVNDQDEDDPTDFLIQSNDGEGISCLKKTPWGMFVGKRSSSHIIKGGNTVDYYQQLISPNVGCLNDRGVQMVDGLLIFPALDGIYGWDGTGPPEIVSKEIEGTYLNVRQISAFVGTELFTSQSDFESGQINKNGTLYNEFTTTATPGNLENPIFGPFRDTNNSDFGQGALDQVSTNSINSVIVSSSVGVAVGTASFTNAGFEQMGINDWIVAGTTQNWAGNGQAVSTGTFQFRNRAVKAPNEDSVCRDSLDFGGVNNTLKIVDAGLGVAIFSQSAHSANTTEETWVNISTYPPNIFIEAWYDVNSNGKITSSTFPTRKGKFLGFKRRFSTESSPGVNCGANLYRMFFDMAESSGINGLTYLTSGTFTSRTFDTQVSTPIWGPMLTDVTYSTRGVVTLRTEVSNDGTNWANLTIISSGSKANAEERRYLRYVSTFTVPDQIEGGPLFSEFLTHATSTGAYTSPAIFISSSISSWRQIVFTEASNVTGKLTYQVRSSSWNIPPSDASIAWTAQTSNANVAVATNTYLSFRAFSTADSSTDTVSLAEVNITWNDGVTNPIASVSHERRYFLSATTSTASTQNDVVFVWQKNKKWTMFTGPSYYSMAVYDNNAIAGSSGNDSYVFKTMQKDVYSDDGEAIRASWITKDFYGEPLSHQYSYKQLNNLWVEASYVSGSSVTVSYAVDKSNSFVNKTLNLSVTNGVVSRRVPIAAGYAKGKYFRFGLANVDLDKYFRIHSLLGVYTVSPLRPDD